MRRITKKRLGALLGSMALATIAASVQAGAAQGGHTAAGQSARATADTRVLDPKALYGVPKLVEKLADKRVVYVGETHDRYEDHLNQLAIIRGLHERNPNLAIGMEFFQQPFQAVLDQYVAGQITEEDLLARTEYFDRWRFDYRLYQPIMRFARENRIPVIALNLPSEITKKVGDGGLAALSDEQRAQVPADLDRGDEGYRNRLRQVYQHHPKSTESDFERFFEVQLLWDEGMAERAASFLRQNPGKRLVVLAGSGHLESGEGIPKRLKRRLAVPSAVVLNGTSRGVDPAVADHLLLTEPVELPQPGLLGILLDTEGGRVTAKGFGERSGAEEAGLKKGDQILRIGERPIRSYTDVRIALLGRAPGEKVSLAVARERLLMGTEELTYEVELR